MVSVGAEWVVGEWVGVVTPFLIQAQSGSINLQNCVRKKNLCQEDSGFLMPACHLVSPIPYITKLYLNSLSTEVAKISLRDKLTLPRTIQGAVMMARHTLPPATP